MHSSVGRKASPNWMTLRFMGPGFRRGDDRVESAPLDLRRGAFYFARMKEALVLVMLVLLIGPLLIGVARLRRLPRGLRREDEES